MHRNIEITVPSEATDSVIEDLQGIRGIITISVQRGHSLRPPGDVISVTARNTDADAVLRAAGRAQSRGTISVATGTVDSLFESRHRARIRSDHDEVSWEEAETAMRRHTRPNVNLIVASAGGGMAAATGLAATSGVTEATAIVAAAIIAPAFEPLARIGMGLVTRHRRMVTGALTSMLLSYGTVIAAAVLTMLLLRTAGPGYASEFLRSPTVHEVRHPPLGNLLLSAAGAVTGAIMVTAGRFSVLAGPIIALQLLPAMATIGAGLELGDPGVAADALGRLGIDVGFVLVACLIVFAYKHVTVHESRAAWN